MSLDSLLSLPDIKFVFVGGKGGVGKTTSSSAIATLLAQYTGKRILLVSTDPAHSLSDAFRAEFSNVPTSPGIKNLHVMEVDPTVTMQNELNNDGDGEGTDGMVQKIKQFQEWLSGIPGIDEATALSTAIQHIESNNYDLIVFDTAPTGHTLKLLQLPEILQAGIEKLQTWQSSLWGYWEVMKGMGSSASKKRVNAKETVATMLEEYKRGIQKVAMMLQDQQRTRFVVVCIAEYLSISETQRLLQELKKNKVRASHIIVNQLVIEMHACRLTTARKSIQETYLSQLKSFPETQEILGDICEVPLLAEEVTGNDALKKFAQFMIR
ncbi:anion transporting ATPase, partial [Thalassiosira pseudonana CCMP1335]